MKRISISFVILILVMLLPAQCAGGGGVVRLQNAEYPVSMSPYIWGPGEESLSIGNGLERARRLYIHDSFWGIMWTKVSLSDDSGITAEMNEKVKEAGGVGVVNFSIIGRECAANGSWTMGFIFLSWLPIFPGCTDVFIQGDIVKLNNKDAN